MRKITLLGLVLVLPLLFAVKCDATTRGHSSRSHTNHQGGPRMSRHSKQQDAREYVMVGSVSCPRCGKRVHARSDEKYLGSHQHYNERFKRHLPCRRARNPLYQK